MNERNEKKEIGTKRNRWKEKDWVGR